METAQHARQHHLGVDEGEADAALSLIPPPASAGGTSLRPAHWSFVDLVMSLLTNWV